MSDCVEGPDGDSNTVHGAACVTVTAAINHVLRTINILMAHDVDCPVGTFFDGQYKCILDKGTAQSPHQNWAAK